MTAVSSRQLQALFENWIETFVLGHSADLQTTVALPRLRTFSDGVLGDQQSLNLPEFGNCGAMQHMRVAQCKARGATRY